MSHKVIVFGEMLWDCLPSGDVPGGAPMNVALHLHQLGKNTQLISAVGTDERGEKLIQFYKQYGASDALIQLKSEQETSRVLVDKTDPENIKYTILSPVAWDYIDLTPENKEAVRSSDAFVFGTLSVRNTHSLKSLLALLHEAKFRVFDANLRPPFYDFEVIETLLAYTDVLKINEDELEAFGDYFNTEADPLSLCQFLDTHFPVDLICITLGSKGAMIYQKGKIINHPGYKIQVEDSIGAGDAFLSGFVKTYLDGQSIAEVLDFSCKLGAFVATQKGGTPRYQLEDLSKIN